MSCVRPFQNITDATVELKVMTLHKADATLTSKDRGGDLEIYINSLWCLSTESSKVCTFYLPQELLAIIIVVVYIAPIPNVTCYTRSAAGCRQHTQVLCSLLQMIVSKLLGMQTTSANICEKMGCSPELNYSSEKL